MRRKFAPNEPQYAVQFFLKKLMPDRYKLVDVDVYLRRMTEQWGQCWSYSDTNRKFTIVIDSDMGRTESLRTLAHETVHVYQHVTGKMKDMWGKKNHGKVQWKGELHENSYDGAAYRNLPWEVEAREKQERLMRSYLRHVRKLRKMGLDSF